MNQDTTFQSEWLALHIDILPADVAELTPRTLIADLRQRLDQSQAQVSQLTAVIAELQPAKAKTGWWQRLLGGQG